VTAFIVGVGATEEGGAWAGSCRASAAVGERRCPVRCLAVPEACYAATAITSRSSIWVKSAGLHV
jgi:hypothetical protein